MTALITPSPVAVRPVSWRHLSWAVWRRHRPALVGLAVLLVALSTYLLITGQQLRSAYADVAACAPPARSATCQFQWMAFMQTHGDSGFIGPFLLLGPGLVGCFVGAPLLGRELETGLFRFSWTQSVGRMRWAVALIVSAAVVLCVAMVGLGVVETWHNWPLVDGGVRQRLEPSTFPTTGPAVVGWTLLGFAGGLLAGVLWRRVVPAIASSFAAWFGLAYVASTVRFHYLAPLTASRNDLRSHDVGIDEWWTKGGVRVSDAEMNQTLAALGVQVNGDSMHAEVGNGGTDPLAYLTAHGYQQMTSYQPDSRYWTFQWIELGWLLVLSGALVALALWWLRRRSV